MDGAASAAKRASGPGFGALLTTSLGAQATVARLAWGCSAELCENGVIAWTA